MVDERRYAILVGVENSLDGSLNTHEYIAGDIRGMRDALKRLGYARKDLLILCGKEATRQSIEVEVESILEKISTEPGSLLVYLAGPGFSLEGRNHLACRDSRIEDLASSSIDLDHLLGAIAGSTGSPIQVFLDCGWNEPARKMLEEEPGVGPLLRDSIELAAEKSGEIALFVSCEPEEGSYSSRRLKHGIWAHHLIEAFSGEVPEILDAVNRLTADRLQGYLTERVPLTLRDTFSDRRKRQSPWMGCRAGEEHFLADLSAIAKERGNPLNTLAAMVKDFSLTGTSQLKVKSLSGFRQGIHRSPKWSSRQAEDFVNRIAVGEIQEELNTKFDDVRRNLGYRRRLIEVRLPGEGDAWIRTPDFQYTLSVSLDEDPSLVVMTRELSDIHRPDILGDERLARTFDDVFATIRLAFDRSVEVEDLIDLAESRGLSIEYPPDCSSCTVRSSDGATVSITGSSLSLTYQSPQPLARLIRGLDQILHLFPGKESVASSAGGARR